jgi:hypothetical protein
MIGTLKPEGRQGISDDAFAVLDFLPAVAHVNAVGLERSRPAFQGTSPKHCTLPARRAKGFGDMSNLHKS